MSDQHEFDELARRKLDELRFSPQEEDWLAAQRLIEAARPANRKRRAFILFALLALLGGAGWWFASSRPGGKEEVAVMNNLADPVSNPAEKTDSKEVTSVPKAAENATPVVEALTSSSETVSDGDARRPARTAERNEGSTHQRNIGQQAVPPRTHQKTNAPTVVSGHVAITSSSTSDVPMNAHGLDRDPDHNDQDATGTSLGLNTDQPQHDADDPSAMNTAFISPPPARPDTSIMTDATTQNDDPAIDPATDYYAVQDSNAVTITRDTIALKPVISTSTDSTTATNDTTRQTSTTRSPWEISVLAGGLFSTSSYTGGTSAFWSDGSTGRWAPTFGAEVMHMGRNFGIGGGIHHVTYAEDLDVSSQSATITSIRDSNYFQSVDTTLFIVTGTTQIDGQTYYITQPFHTTVQILINGTATSMSTREVIRAMKAVNRVSYLEVPLLFDGHLGKGAWSFGVRGGPTIGVLSGKRGTLPNTSFDGYLSNEERSFKSVMFGATARAYIRYRFCGSWAAGIEPTWRAQFGDALGGGEIVRRNSGWGGLISLSYRLR